MKKLDYTKLKGLREENNLTQDEMSKMLNMTQSNYSKLESGSKKIDSLKVLQDIAKVLKMPLRRLIGILGNQTNINSSGMSISELIQIEEILKENPIREDEFIFFSTEVLELEKHEFKDKYSGLNMKELDESKPFPIWDYPPEMNIIIADSVEIGFEYHRNKLKEVSIWLGDKKLGVISEEYSILVDQLINQLLISRVVLIENEYGDPGFFDTYMKVVFIATNAVAKSAKFVKGRFSSLRFLSQAEIEQIDNEAN